MKVTICGSLRFEDDIQKWHEALAFNGYTPYCMVAMPSQKNNKKEWYSTYEKMMLDLIHLSKIEESDDVLIVDTAGYIGESTQREIQWAKIRDKAIYYASEQDEIGSLLVQHDFSEGF